MRGIDNLRAVIAAIASAILAIGIVGNYYFFDFIDTKNIGGERISSVSAHIIFDTLVFSSLSVLTCRILFFRIGIDKAFRSLPLDKKIL